ncbi:unnamed protein product [Agarophyton chilense]
MLRGFRHIQTPPWSSSCVVALLALLPSAHSVCEGDQEPSPASMMPRTALESFRRRRSSDVSAKQMRVSDTSTVDDGRKRVHAVASRASLAEYYNAFPDPVASEAFLSALTPMAEFSHRVVAALADSDRVKVDEIRSRRIPKGLDSSMFCIRCACEEASGHLRSISTLEPLAPKVQTIATRLEFFQFKQSEHISSVIAGFLPTDFRGSLFSAYKQRSERVNRQAIDDLMSNGGTIQQKYDLMWQHQWKRRESLAMIGNATGVWRWLVRFLAGVPENLLLFARDINAPNGLTEPLRAKFSPALHDLANCAIEIDVLSTALLHVDDAQLIQEAKELLECCITQYEVELATFVKDLQTVIVNSPFFVQPSEAENIRNSAPVDDATEGT